MVEKTVVNIGFVIFCTAVVHGNILANLFTTTHQTPINFGAKGTLTETYRHTETNIQRQ